MVANYQVNNIFFCKITNFIKIFPKKLQTELNENITIKTNFQISFQNLYAKSSFFKKCCVDCSPNSSVCFKNKLKLKHYLKLLS